MNYSKMVRNASPAPSAARDRAPFISILMLMYLMLAAVAVPAGAAVYKWVDENGVTQYTATPPPDRKTTTLHVESPPPATETDRALLKLEEHISESKDKDAKAKKDAEEEAGLIAKQKKRNSENCRLAKEDLYRLQLHKPVFTLNDKGERSYIDDQQRASRIKEREKEVADFCE